MSMFLLALVTLSALLTVALLRMEPYIPPTQFEREMAEFRRRTVALQVAIGTALLPAFRNLAVAAREATKSFEALREKGSSPHE